MQHLLSVRQIEVADIDRIFLLTRQVEQNPGQFCLSKKIMISFFGEPSTRTRFSFEAAAAHLGMRTITAADASVSSSLRKGESWKDTFRTLSQYGDIMVCRHIDPTWVDAAKLFSRIPVINAGNGADEHPTQALLDLYTIIKEVGRLIKLKVMICGDLKYGRTVHSLVGLLRKLYDSQVYVVPAVGCNLTLPSCTELNFDEAEYILPTMDVVYMTRIQKERQDAPVSDYFRLQAGHLNKMKEKSAILHPLPRGDEIAQDVDDDPRAAYHERQVKNGLYVRIALLKMLLEDHYNNA